MWVFGPDCEISEVWHPQLNSKSRGQEIHGWSDQEIGRCQEAAFRGTNCDAFTSDDAQCLMIASDFLLVTWSISNDFWKDNEIIRWLYHEEIQAFPPSCQASGKVSEAEALRDSASHTFSLACDTSILLMERNSHVLVNILMYKCHWNDTGTLWVYVDTSLISIVRHVPAQQRRQQPPPKAALSFSLPVFVTNMRS